MNSFLEVLNHPIDAFRNKSKAVAWFLVAATILINAVFEPLLAWSASSRYAAPDVYLMLRTALWGCASYLAICAVFWAISKCFGSKTPLITYLKTWGLTFFPTLLCSIAVAFSETFFTVFWNNSIWGILLSIAFVGIFIWKTILYVIFLREVAGLKGGRMTGAFIVIGIMVIALALFNGYVGVKTPVL
ncbi:MAG: YIP1 family protein [Burkholderiales bacterium]